MKRVFKQTKTSFDENIQFQPNLNKRSTLLQKASDTQQLVKSNEIKEQFSEQKPFLSQKLRNNSQQQEDKLQQNFIKQLGDIHKYQNQKYQNIGSYGDFGKAVQNQGVNESQTSQNQIKQITNRFIYIHQIKSYKYSCSFQPSIQKFNFKQLYLIQCGQFDIYFKFQKKILNNLLKNQMNLLEIFFIKGQISKKNKTNQINKNNKTSQVILLEFKNIQIKMNNHKKNF